MNREETDVASPKTYAMEAARSLVRNGTRDEEPLVAFLVGSGASVEEARAALVIAKMLDWLRPVHGGQLGLGDAWLLRFFSEGDVPYSANERAKAVAKMRLDAGLSSFDPGLGRFG